MHDLEESDKRLQSAAGRRQDRQEGGEPEPPAPVRHFRAHRRRTQDEAGTLAQAQRQAARRERGTERNHQPTPHRSQAPQRASRSPEHCRGGQHRQGAQRTGGPDGRAAGEAVQPRVRDQTAARGSESPSR